jgi:hypothetical protein
VELLHKCNWKIPKNITNVKFSIILMGTGQEINLCCSDDNALNLSLLIITEGAF